MNVGNQKITESKLKDYRFYQSSGFVLRLMKRRTILLDGGMGVLSWINSAECIRLNKIQWLMIFSYLLPQSNSKLELRRGNSTVQTETTFTYFQFLGIIAEPVTSVLQKFVYHLTVIDQSDWMKQNKLISYLCELHGYAIGSL